MTVGDRGKQVVPNPGLIQLLVDSFQLPEKRAVELLIKHDNDINRCIDDLTKSPATRGGNLRHLTKFYLRKFNLILFL
jgi:hypothetical protein